MPESKLYDGPYLTMAQRVREETLADPAKMHMIHVMLLAGIEAGRRMQEWRQGKRFRLEHEPLGRQDDEQGPVVVCRAKLIEEDGAGAVIKAADGTLRHWQPSMAPCEDGQLPVLSR